jgi:uncharacterized OB-fold protein
MTIFIQRFFIDQLLFQENIKKSENIMDSKLFKKTYPYICKDCGEFAHTQHEYCDKCGAKNSLRIAEKADYKKRFK